MRNWLFLLLGGLTLSGGCWAESNVLQKEVQKNDCPLGYESMKVISIEHHGDVESLKIKSENGVVKIWPVPGVMKGKLKVGYPMCMKENKK